MKWFYRCFQESFTHCRQLRSLITAALFIALNLVLDMVRIDVSSELRIGVGFLTQAMIGMLFGPALCMLSGAITDVLSFLIKPTGAYFPGFTLTAIVGGLIYGLALYRWHESGNFIQKESKLSPLLLLRQAGRAFLAKGAVNLFCNIMLNTLWLSILYGNALAILLPERLLKNLLLWPLESLLLFVVAGVVAAAMRILNRMRPQTAV